MLVECLPELAVEFETFYQVVDQALPSLGRFQGGAEPSINSLLSLGKV
jgi:hypothetical protein